MDEDIVDGFGFINLQQHKPNIGCVKSKFGEKTLRLHIKESEKLFCYESKAEWKNFKHGVMCCKIHIQNHHRHILWQMLLSDCSLTPSTGLLSLLKRLKLKRKEYDIYKQEYCNVDERRCEALDVSMNNPLSQDVNSPWQKFFSDTHLRKEIMKDVVRTHGEGDLFKQEWVISVMNVVLFIHAKKCPQLAYKQGMHELLATIIQTQYECCLYFNELMKKHALLCEENEYSKRLTVGERSVLDVLQCLNDLKFLEHDVYFLFDSLIRKLWEWYYVTSPGKHRDQPNPTNTTNNNDDVHNKLPVLFKAKSYSAPPKDNIEARLDYIWHSIFRSFDQPLYNHLQNCQIIPATFGINWTRLLFTRQFLNEDRYAVLWDVLFASSFYLLDYIVVAMIVTIRSHLLISDAMECTSTLVSRYPPNVNAQYVATLALHISNPLQYNKPQNMSPLIFENMTSGQRVHHRSAVVPGVTTVKKLEDVRSKVSTFGRLSLSTTRSDFSFQSQSQTNATKKEREMSEKVSLEEEEEGDENDDIVLLGDVKHQKADDFQIVNVINENQSSDHKNDKKMYSNLIELRTSVNTHVMCWEEQLERLLTTHEHPTQQLKSVIEQMKSFRHSLNLQVLASHHDHPHRGEASLSVDFIVNQKNKKKPVSHPALSSGVLPNKPNASPICQEEIS